MVHQEILIFQDETGEFGHDSKKEEVHKEEGHRFINQENLVLVSTQKTAYFFYQIGNILINSLL